MLFSMITDGSETSPNSNMKVVMLRKSSDLRKTKNEETPVPKRLVRQRNTESGSKVALETFLHFIRLYRHFSFSFSHSLDRLWYSLPSQIRLSSGVFISTLQDCSYLER